MWSLYLGSTVPCGHQFVLPLPPHTNRTCQHILHCVSYCRRDFLFPLLLFSSTVDSQYIYRCSHKTPQPNHQRWYAKMEAQLEHMHPACTFFACLAQTCRLGRCFISKTSASELSRKFIKSLLLVGNCEGCQNFVLCAAGIVTKLCHLLQTLMDHLNLGFTVVVGAASSEGDFLFLRCYLFMGNWLVRSRRSSIQTYPEEENVRKGQRQRGRERETTTFVGRISN